MGLPIIRRRTRAKTRDGGEPTRRRRFSRILRSQLGLAALSALAAATPASAAAWSGAASASRAAAVDLRIPVVTVVRGGGAWDFEGIADDVWFGPGTSAAHYLGFDLNGDGWDEPAFLANGTLFTSPDACSWATGATFTRANGLRAEDRPVAVDASPTTNVDSLWTFTPSTASWRAYEHGQWRHKFTWGTSAMIPVPLDVNGDGLDEPALYEPATGYWFIGRSEWFRGQSLSNMTHWKRMQFGWGSNPITGDYNSDGVDDIGVFVGTSFYLATIPKVPDLHLDSRQPIAFRNGVNVADFAAGDVAVNGRFATMICPGVPQVSAAPTLSQTSVAFGSPIVASAPRFSTTTTAVHYAWEFCARAPTLSCRETNVGSAAFTPTLENTGGLTREKWLAGSYAVRVRSIGYNVKGGSAPTWSTLVPVILGPSRGVIDVIEWWNSSTFAAAGWVGVEGLDGGLPVSLVALTADGMVAAQTNGTAGGSRPDVHNTWPNVGNWGGFNLAVTDVSGRATSVCVQVNNLVISVSCRALPARIAPPPPPPVVPAPPAPKLLWPGQDEKIPFDVRDGEANPTFVFAPSEAPGPNQWDYVEYSFRPFGLHSEWIRYGAESAVAREMPLFQRKNEGSFTVCARGWRYAVVSAERCATPHRWVYDTREALNDPATADDRIRGHLRLPRGEVGSLQRCTADRVLTTEPLDPRQWIIQLRLEGAYQNDQLHNVTALAWSYAQRSQVERCVDGFYAFIDYEPQLPKWSNVVWTGVAVLGIEIEWGWEWYDGHEAPIDKPYVVVL